MVPRMERLWQSARVDLADQLPQALVQIGAGAVEVEDGAGARRLAEHGGARAGAGGAQHILQLLALCDEIGWVGRRPGEQDRLLDLRQALDGGAAVIAARVRA